MKVRVVRDCLIDGKAVTAGAILDVDANKAIKLLARELVVDANDPVTTTGDDKAVLTDDNGGD